MDLKRSLSLLLLGAALLLPACGGGGGNLSGGGNPPPPIAKQPKSPSREPSKADLPPARRGWNYWCCLAHPPSPGPFAFQLLSGDLPPGLSLDEKSGEIEGRPARKGTFLFSVLVKDVKVPANSREWILTLSVKEPWDSTPPKTKRFDFFFIHHSVGMNLWLRGPLAVELYKHNYMPYDMFYGEGKVDGYVIGDHTDIPDWPVDFNTPKYFRVMYTWELKGGRHHDVMAFKSCFPNSDIESEAKLERFKECYRSLLPTFKAHPDTLFIPFSTPPLNPASTSKANAARARRLANWLKYEYSAQLPNVIAFDFFHILANPPDHPTEPNMLRKEYRSGTDSHPTKAGDQAVTRLFLPFLNAALRAAGLEP